MVECEFFHYNFHKENLSVLIDTWWNVNELELPEWYKKYGVLIDTWWNVNIRVNLDIIERDLVLIDTWWNVNFL